MWGESGARCAQNNASCTQHPGSASLITRTVLWRPRAPEPLPGEGPRTAGGVRDGRQNVQRRGAGVNPKTATAHSETTEGCRTVTGERF